MLLYANSSAQLSKVIDVIEQLQQQVINLESQGMDRMHSAVASTKQTVTEVQQAVQRVFTHASSTGTKIDALISRAESGKAVAAAAAAPCPSPSPSPAPRVQRLVVSMSSFPGRAEFAIPTVYSIMCVADLNTRSLLLQC
jgi:DNA-directed RNA polymerase